MLKQKNWTCFVSVMDSSLPTSLKYVISNVEYYGPVLFMAGMTLLFQQTQSCFLANTGKKKQYMWVIDQA